MAGITDYTEPYLKAIAASGGFIWSGYDIAVTDPDESQPGFAYMAALLCSFDSLDGHR